MDTSTQVQTLNKTDCILHCTNSFQKGMNPIILPTAMVKSKANWVFYSWLGNQSRRRKTLNLNLLNSAYKLILCHILPEWWGE